jgi:hypothetical protein
MAASGAVRAWLRRHGAETISHPGGTLYAHLCRVHDRLGTLGTGADLRLAGLAHAVYGTDGFDVVLLSRADRVTLRDLVGDGAERLVYLYGACDRRWTWPRLADTGQVVDRFTGQVHTPDPATLRSFVDLSIVNELDVVERDPAVAARHGGYLRGLFPSWARIASPRVSRDADQVLATGGSPTTAGPNS